MGCEPVNGVNVTANGGLEPLCTVMVVSACWVSTPLASKGGDAEVPITPHWHGHRSRGDSIGNREIEHQGGADVAHYASQSP